MEGEKPLGDIQERQTIAKLEREELEDKFLRLREQNIELKKYARKQEDKIKRMATKLLRLVADKKKVESVDGAIKRDIETEEKMEELQETVRELERQNSHLKNKVALLKQQSHSAARRPSPYGHVKAKVNTGVHSRTKSSQQQRISQNLRVQGDNFKPAKHVPPPLLPQPRYGHSLLEEARIEKEELEQVIHSLQEDIRALEADRRELRDELRQREREHELVMTKVREELSGAQRNNIQENVDMIKLQREVKEKATKLQALETKYLSLNENLSKMKESHSQVLDNMEKLNEKLKEEQAKSLMYQNELKSSGVTSRTLVEQQQLIDDLKAERDILKQANENLVKSAFDTDRERQYQALERQLKVEIATLEATVKSELEEKNEILDQLMKERESNENLHDEIRDLKVNHFSLKEKHDELMEKMKFFTKESAVDVQELEEALTLIKRRKETGSQDLDFLEKVDEEIDKDTQKHIQELQASHADTINELEKTRNMLVLQHKINKDYQMEVDRVSKKMVEDKKEYDLRLQEYAQLLDIRADRIKKLESQMRDIAYGTKQFNLTKPPEENEFEEDSTVSLERGENLFEIHIGKVYLTGETASSFDEVEPSFFVTYEFFEHEIQATPVMKGKRVDFNFTSLYVVKVDDFFLHYLQKESTLVELHRALGSSYETVAACGLKLRELLERSHGRLHGTAKLIGTQSSNDGSEVATMEYWVRLRVPMEQAIRLFKERSKALGYLNAQDYKALDKSGDELPSDVNELFITILRCSELKARREDVQPSPYVVYRFYDFADHDTDIIPNSNNPQWNDRKTCPVPMTEELDTYLRSQSLDVYVLDDVDPEPTAYLGIAKIPLISLAHGKPIKGSFQLNKESGETNGAVDVLLEWRNTYLPGSAKIKTQPQYLPVAQEEIDRERAAVIQEEPEDNRPTPVPLNTSTPKQSHDNVVRKPPKARPRSGKKKTSLPSSASSLNEVKKGINEAASVAKETKVEESSDEHVEVHKDMSIDELILASEDLPGKVDQEREKIPDNIPQPEKVETGGSDSQDTMFADEETDSPVNEDDVAGGLFPQQHPENFASGSEAQTSDSDGVVMSSMSVRGAATPQAPPQVTIMVSSLTLYPDTTIIRNPSITQLFVAYKFLNCDPAELETPVSLPKPPANRPIHFNFKNVFPVDSEQNEVKRDWLVHTISPDNPDQGRLVFTVVSEPSSVEEGDCVDIAFAVVDLLQIVKDNTDIVEQDIELYSLLDRNELVGCLTVTVEALEALKSLYTNTV